jgi:hypothetical protein
MPTYAPSIQAGTLYQVSVYTMESGKWGFPNLSSSRRTLRVALVDSDGDPLEVSHFIQYKG